MFPDLIATYNTVGFTAALSSGVFLHQAPLTSDPVTVMFADG